MNESETSFRLGLGGIPTVSEDIMVASDIELARIPRPKATPELVKQGILVSAQCGADALTIGHYDGAWMDCLRAIRQGIEEAGIEIRPDAPVCSGKTS